MQAGTTKDQGLYNKPSAAVHPRALAAGSLPQYNTILPCGFQRVSVRPAVKPRLVKRQNAEKLKDVFS